MNNLAFERHLNRLLLIAIFVHVYRDWDVGWRVVLVLAMFGYCWVLARTDKRPGGHL